MSLDKSLKVTNSLTLGFKNGTDVPNCTRTRTDGEIRSKGG